MTHKAIFLDRDGIINKVVLKKGKPAPPIDFNEFELTEGIVETLQVLKQAGYLLIIFTNQPDVRRGDQTQTRVEAFHRHIQEILPIDRVYVCYHDSQDNCDCRKPKPGMLKQAQQDFNIDFQKSFVVGDRWRDVDAGNAVGCRTLFMDYQYDESLRTQPSFIIHKIRQVLDIVPDTQPKS